MTYSMDADANKENPNSPSEQLSVSQQLVYRLASLDAAVTGGFRHVSENLERLRSDFHDNQLTTNDRFNAIERDFEAKIVFKRERMDRMEREAQARREVTEKRIIELETWRKVAIAQISIFVTAISLGWVIFAPTIRHWLGVPA